MVLSRMEASRSRLARLAAGLVLALELSTRARAPRRAMASETSRAPSATAMTEKLSPWLRLLSTASAIDSSL